MATLIVVEGHPLLQLGMLQLLSSKLPDSNIYGANHAAQDVIGVSESCDLVILAVPSQESEALKIIQTASQQYRPRAILLLTENDDIFAWFHHCPAQVIGHIPKYSTPSLFLASVKLALAGGTCFPRHMGSPSGVPPSWSERSDDDLSAFVAGHDAVLPEHAKLCLTRRQYDVLVHLARGHTMKKIGKILNISAATAKAHARVLYRRLNVHNRNAAVYAAIERGATLGWPSIETARQHASEVDEED